MVYGILHIINLAHGEMFMIGAFLTFFIFAITGNYAVAIVLVVIITVALGLLMERFIFRPLIPQPRINSLIVSIGLSLVLSNGALLLWGAEPRFFETSVSREVMVIGPLSFSAQRGLVVLVTLILIASLTFFHQRTRLGKAMRAAAQDLEACSLIGIDTRRVIAVAFGLSAGLAGVAGSLLSPIYTMSYDMGLLAVLKAFAIVIVGGFGNIPGTIIAAFLLAIAESLGGGFISATYQDTIVFVILIVALLIRPTGLISERLEENI